MRLTVFTPTYNRKYTLGRIYQSFFKQDITLLGEVEWLIVDDGSTDGTEQLVSTWLKENIPFTLRYIKKSNGGKHTAFNNAVKEAKGDLFFVVDSDDWLDDNCISNILNKALIIRNNENLCGIIALKCLPNNVLLGTPYPENINIASQYELVNMGYGGERSLVFKTEILRQYPYPVIPEERFIGECVVYDQIDTKYKYFVSNDVLTVCEYQENGLTSNFFKLMMQNATGYKIFYAQRIDMAVRIKERFGYAIRYWAFKMMKQDSLYNYKGKHKTFVLCSFPFGCVVYIYYKLKKV